MNDLHNCGTINVFLKIFMKRKVQEMILYERDTFGDCLVKVLGYIGIPLVLVFVLYIKKKRNSNPRSFKIVDNTPLLNAV